MSDFINITATDCFLDASGAKIASGTLTVIATDAKDRPIPFRIGTASGQATQQVVSRAIAAGSMVGTLQLADPANSSPVNILYRFVVTDNTTNKVSTYPKVFISPTSGAWDFSAMNTGLSLPQIPYVPVVGPPGTPGTDGTDGANGTLISTNKGVWSSATTYAIGDFVSKGGASFASLTSGNINHDPVLATATTPSANWQMIAQAGDVTIPQVQKHLALDVQERINVLHQTFTNVYDASRVALNTLITSATGATAALANYDCSDYCLVAGASFITFNIAGVSFPYGVAFYDYTKAFISGANSPASGTPLAVPATAVYMRFGSSHTNMVKRVMCVLGSTLPTAFVPYALPDILAKSTVALAQTLDVAKLPLVRNLFDLNRAIVGHYNRTTGALETPGAAYSSSGFMSVTPGDTLCINIADVTSNPVYGAIFYDETFSIIASTALPFTAGQTFVVPTGAVWATFPFVTANASKLMITNSATAPVGYVPFLGAPPVLSPWNGKKWGMWGDSITFYALWQPSFLLRTGLVPTFQDATPGRSFTTMFTYYGGDGTGVNSTSSPNIQYNNGTTGNTLAQDLAGLDVLVVWLGTNDTATTLGTIADGVAVASLYGYIRRAIVAFITAKPTLRLVMVTPYYRGGSAAELNVNVAIKAVAAQYAVPVINLYDNSQINPLTTATLLSDGLHINAAGAAIVGPLIAQNLSIYG